MNRHEDEMTRSLRRELHRADRIRRQALTLASTIAVVATLVGGAALVAGLSSSRESAKSPVVEQGSEVRAATVLEPDLPRKDEGVEEEYSATEKASPAGDTEQTTKSEKKPEPKAKPRREKGPRLQHATIMIGELGYEPSTVVVKSGADVELTVAKGEGCAAGFLMPELGIAADNSVGPATIRLAKLDQGTYRFTCGMEMVEGRLVVE